jgi:hypothetical protein
LVRTPLMRTARLRPTVGRSAVERGLESGRSMRTLRACASRRSLALPDQVHPPGSGESVAARGCDM